MRAGSCTCTKGGDELAGRPPKLAAFGPASDRAFVRCGRNAKRLDDALRQLEVPAGTFGAGGLRGGGACAASRQERDIAKLVLEIAEVSAAIGMQALSPAAKQNVETAERLYSALLDAS